MDPENSVQATRFVTARELGRQSGELLDAVIDGARLVITRHGLPVAVIEATENVALLQRVRRTAPVDAFEEPEVEIDLDSFELPDEAFVVLEAYARHQSRHEVSEETGLHHGKVAIAMSRLEIARLTVRGLGSLTVSPLGQRVIEAWKKRVGPPEPD